MNLNELISNILRFFFVYLTDFLYLSSLALPGSSSKRCCLKILTFQASPSSVDERFCRQKSTLFINISGALKSALFSVILRAQTLLRVNSAFNSSKTRQYSD